jgi:hypothetical protein
MENISNFLTAAKKVLLCIEIFHEAVLQGCMILLLIYCSIFSPFYELSSLE